MTRVRKTTILVYQAFDDKKQPPFKARILQDLGSRWLLEFITDSNEKITRRVLKGVCQTIKEAPNET